MEPTPKYYSPENASNLKVTESNLWCRNSEMKRATDLESRHHLSLFLAVQDIVVILHRDERREVVFDGVVLPVQA